MSFDLYRTLSKGMYDTDFDNIAESKAFPSPEVLGRNAVYNYYNRLYTGEYAKRKKIIAMVKGIEVEIPYKIIPLNFFKLIVNKLVGMIFSGDITYKTGDIEKDKLVYDLVERTGWANSIMRGVKMAEVMGDCALKTFVDGVSAFSPCYCYKVVSKHNKDNVKGYVLYELLHNNETNKEAVTHIRIEIHTKGKIYELAYEYIGSYAGGSLGKPVALDYNGRMISKNGNQYDTGLDVELIQWLAINKDCDSVYGQSSLIDIKDIVFTLEQRLSSELWVMDNHEKPILVVGMNNILENETTGGYELKQINGKYLVNTNGSDGKPEYITYDGKLENSKIFRDDLMSYFYELTEMGKTFLSGEYSGNISEETLNSTIKSAIDRANRDLTDVWYDIRKSLYVLCKLNGIELSLHDLSITFNIGRVDSDTAIAAIVKSLNDIGIFSKATLLEKYFGYSQEQAEEELKKVNMERGEIKDGKSKAGGLPKEDIRATD